MAEALKLVLRSITTALDLMFKIASLPKNYPLPPNSMDS